MKKYVRANKSNDSEYIKSVVEVSDNPNEPIDLSNDPDDTVYGVETIDEYHEFMNRYRL
jgi:hypothetical protein